jgi:hypothetical protein
MSNKFPMAEGIVPKYMTEAARKELESNPIKEREPKWE